MPSDETIATQVLATQLHALLVLTVARDRFGKAYFDLQDTERDEVEGTVGGMLRHYWQYYQTIPPRILEVQGRTDKTQ